MKDYVWSLPGTKLPHLGFVEAGLSSVSQGLEGSSGCLKADKMVSAIIMGWGLSQSITTL
jgi:hypothetical protein